jgi:hypothetical protein
LLPNNVPPLPNGEDDAASALGLLRLLPPKAFPPPKIPPGLPAAAPPPKTFDEPVLAPAPNMLEPPAGVLAPELAVPKRPGADPPDVLLTAPNSGLLALPLFCCPKLPKPDMVCGVCRGDREGEGEGDGSWELGAGWCCAGCAQELFTRARRAEAAQLRRGKGAGANRVQTRKAQSQKAKMGNDGRALDFHVFHGASMSRLPKVQHGSRRRFVVPGHELQTARPRYCGEPSP